MPMQSSPPLGGSEEGLSAWSLVTAVGVGTVIAVALALVTATASEGEDETRPRADAGEVFTATTDKQDLGSTAEIALPWRRLGIGVGEPVRELPELVGAPADVAPPDGGRFVPVWTEPVVGDRPQQDAPAFIAKERPLRTAARVVLIADGQEYPVGGAGGLTEAPDDRQSSQSDTRWVAVEGDPSTVEVSVVTGGQEQTVRPDGTVTRGRAAALDDLPTREEVEMQEQEPVACGARRRVDDSDFRIEGSRPERCEITAALRTPFVDGLGWAPKGKEYLVVQFMPERPALVESPDGEDRRWGVTSQVDSRLGSLSPRAGPTDLNAQRSGALASDQPQQVVFEVPQGRSPGDLVIGLDIRAEPDDPFAGSEDAERLRLRWTVPAGRLP